VRLLPAPSSKASTGIWDHSWSSEGRFRSHSPRTSRSWSKPGGGHLPRHRIALQPRAVAPITAPWGFRYPQPRRLKAPDSLVACYQNAPGEWKILSPTEAMHLLNCCATDQTIELPGDVSLPTLDQPKAIVQAELRRKLEYREPSTRALASWSWLAIARVGN
jgi:hypothetical protein